MRATRAYLAGFGTSGSLLAGAALMFLLASAIVGFHGWPQVGGQSSVANVLAPNVTVSPSSRASRILAAISSSHARSVSARAALAGGGARGLHGAPMGFPRASSSSPALSAGLHAATSPRCASARCGPVLAAPANTTVLTGQVSQAVAQTGAKVGSSVSSAVNNTAAVVAPVSPGGASTIKKIGHGTGHAVSRTSTGVATQVSTTGSTVSSLTHH